MLIIMSVTIITLLLSGAVAFYEVIDSGHKIKREGEDISKEISLNTSKLLEDEMKIELTKLANSKAEEITHRMRDSANDVALIADEMNEIYRNPSRFLPQTVDEPSQTQSGKTNFYIQYSETFDRTAFADEIAISSRIKDFLIRIVENNSMIVSIGIISRDGYTISADDDRDVNIADFEQPPLTYETTESEWYQKAIKEEKLIFSDVRQFVLSNALGGFCAIPYYNENGEIMGVTAGQIFLDKIEHLLDEIELYDTGFCFVVDNRGYVILNSDDDIPAELLVSLTDKLQYSQNEDLSKIAVEMTAGKNDLREITLNGKEYYIVYAPIKATGWSFGAAISKEEVIEPVIRNKEIIEAVTTKNIDELEKVLMNKIILVAIFMVVILAIVIYVNRKLSDNFVKPIYELSNNVREIAKGDFNKKIDIKTGDEIEHLAACFNAMTGELKTYIENLTKITAEKEKMATELEVAKNIQISMLPHDFNFNRNDFEIYAMMNAAKEVGGDFYDFYLLDENHLVITIADVSGKGVPAALFMANSKTILKNFAMTMVNPDDLSAVMTCANQQLCENNKEKMFVTVFMGMLDLKTGEFIFVNGGHNPPLIYRKSENHFEYLKLKKSCILGIKKKLSFNQQSIQFESGDMIFLYTDGVTEAMNSQRKQYTSSRLQNFLDDTDDNISLETLLEIVRKDIKNHTGDAEQSDDITMVALRFRSGENGE